jgi:hypothetical protein
MIRSDRRRRGNGFWKIQIRLDFFLSDFVGLDYFGCGCPHAKFKLDVQSVLDVQALAFCLALDVGPAYRFDFTDLHELADCHIKACHQILVKSARIL